MEVETAHENGVEGDAQTSIVAAVKVPVTPKKNPWKTKYLILKRKCDQIDQVFYKTWRGIHVFVPQQFTLFYVLDYGNYGTAYSKCGKPLCLNSKYL